MTDKIKISDIRFAIKEVSEKDYFWKDEDMYAPFKSDYEKELYLRGVKYGYSSALFWIADYFNLVKFFEKLKF